MSSVTSIKTNLKKIAATSLWLVFTVMSFSALPAYADFCGDNIVEGVEQCDDGDFESGDGCSNVCVIEANWFCSGAPSVCQFTNPCAAGAYWNGSTCVDAAAGYYVSASNPLIQMECLVGSYQPNTGSTSCLPATAGHFVNSLASATQTECALGSYQPSEGSSACIPAPVGSFVNATAATSATPCVPGEYQPGEGSSSCLQATEGHFASGGSAIMSECSPGSYQPAAGSASCILASAGFYVSASGATAQTACAASYYSGIGEVACHFAGLPSYPHMAVAGTPAVASDINENLDALLDAINQLNARLAVLESKPTQPSIIGTYDFVNVGAQISSDTSINTHLSHNAGRGYFHFASGGVVTGFSGWAGSYVNINNTVQTTPATGLYSHVTAARGIDAGNEPFSGSYTLTGPSLSISFGDGPINGTVSPDGKIIILTLHDGDDGILIAIRR